MTGLLPGFDPTLKVRDISISQLFQCAGSQCRASARRAVEDRPAVRIKFRPMVGTGGIGIELEHPARRMDRSRNRAVLSTLLRFTQINERGRSFRHLASDVIRGQILSSTLRFGNQLGSRRGFRGYGIPPSCCSPGANGYGIFPPLHAECSGSQRADGKRWRPGEYEVRPYGMAARYALGGHGVRPYDVKDRRRLSRTGPMHYHPETERFNATQALVRRERTSVCLTGSKPTLR